MYEIHANLHFPHSHTRSKYFVVVFLFDWSWNFNHLNANYDQHKRIETQKGSAQPKIRHLIKAPEWTDFKYICDSGKCRCIVDNGKFRQATLSHWQTKTKIVWSEWHGFLVKQEYRLNPKHFDQICSVEIAEMLHKVECWYIWAISVRIERSELFM